MTYSELSKKHPVFIYKSFSIRELKNSIEFSFEFVIQPDIIFRPRVSIPKLKQACVNKDVLNNIAFHLGLAEIPSYWKVACSPTIVLEAGRLSKKQARFLRKLITKGLGEFFYKHKIDFTRPGFLRTINAPNAPKLKANRSQKLDSSRALVPFGGGKDSIVTLEILRKTKLRVDFFHLRTKTYFKTPASKLHKITERNEELVARRVIDGELLSLIKKGYLSGHTPFSAYLAFASVGAAILNGYKYVVLSNERSANEGNVRYKGRIINHQWSKSHEFEKLFNQYSREFLSSQIYYFSLLRPINETQIAKIFVRYPEHFAHFNSCNVGTKSGVYSWCGACSKCLFVYALLYPHLDDKTLTDIFGQDLFKKKELLGVAKQLAGMSGHKPFECVGTEGEVVSAFREGLEKRKGRPPLVLRDMEPFLRNRSGSRNYFSKQHLLPKQFEKLLRAALR